MIASITIDDIPAGILISVLLMRFAITHYYCYVSYILNGVAYTSKYSKRWKNDNIEILIS